MAKEAQSATMTKVQSETLERSCLMCERSVRVIAKVGPLEIKAPCPNACKGGYAQRQRAIRKES